MMMTNPSDQPRQNIDDELVRMLKYLRLSRLLTHWDETLEKARKGRYSSERLLKHIVEEEYRAKRENSRLLRRQRANIPEMLEIETFPFDKQPKLDRKRVMSIYDSFDYMTKQRGVVWLGPTGCGKTGLATGFLLQAIDRGYRGYFITFPELIQELFQSMADRSDHTRVRKVFGSAFAASFTYSFPPTSSRASRKTSFNSVNLFFDPFGRPFKFAVLPVRWTLWSMVQRNYMQDRQLNLPSS